jgi:hypothetical protein
MAVTMWSQQIVSCNQSVVSTDTGWQSQCAVKREQMAVIMWFQQRVAGDQNVVSGENR